MPVRIVQSKQNARLKKLRRALAKPGHEGLAGPLVGIEGPILIAEALRAGLRVDCVFAAQEAEPLLAALPLPSPIDVLLFPRLVLDAVLTTETPQPVAALIAPPLWTWEHILEGIIAGQEHSALKGHGLSRVQKAKNHREALAPAEIHAPLILILAGLQDPGNLGTILRSAEAFGASGIVCLPGTVSEWNPKAVRASAGSVFRVPLIASSENACIGQLRKKGVKILATTARAAQSADLVDMAGPIALVIGNEGNGVPRELAAQADAAITIACPGPVESLNAAVATSVLLYEAARQRALQRAAKGRAR